MRDNEAARLPALQRSFRGELKRRLLHCSTIVQVSRQKLWIMRRVPPHIEQEAQAAHQQLLDRIRAAWEDLERIIVALLASDPASTGTAETAARVLLLDPLHAFIRARPLDRLLEAMEAWRQWRNHLAGQADNLAPDLPAPVLADLFRGIEIRQGRQLGILVTLMARAATELTTPWQLQRRASLRALAGITGGQDFRSAHAAWRRRTEGLRKDIGLQIERLAAPPPLRLSGRPVRPSRAARQEKLLDDRMAWWTRNARAATAMLALEEAIWKASCEIEQATRAGLAVVQQDRRELLAEIDGLISWLQIASGPMPERRIALSKALELTARWMAAVESLARELVPAQLETVAHWKPMPARRAAWRLVQPRRDLLASLERTGRPALLAAFQQAHQVHRVALQDIERARQVIAFSEELAAREGEQGQRAAREALANALLLLRHRRSSLADLRTLLEEPALRAVATALYRFYLRLDRDRVGLWKHLARQGVLEGLAAAGEQASATARTIARSSQQAWRSARRHLLARIGWEQPAPRALAHVERRPVLSQVLGVDLAPRGISFIYQRLFRPEPVDDLRFLIGRDAEMAAMADLRRLWEAGQPACAVLVGEQGSGKTSLINCALAQVFAGLPVVRTQFKERIWQADQMRRFLQQHVEQGPSHRGIVILEELERAWLRCVGGYEALRELLAQVVSTSRRLLWIVAINNSAFRLLNAILGLERYFSHRINAAAVERPHLEEAILMRHNLTGLRLHFLAAREGAKRGARWRRRLGLQPSPQSSFFEGLYQESEGLFRSAFELWLKHIEQSHDGVLYVRPLEKPRYDALFAGLDLRELLTLQALLQHGSLSPDEHAAVFDISPRTSLDQLEILENCELVEKEPAGGFRVRPEAARAVRVALHRRNLL